MHEKENTELITADAGTVALLNQSEIDMQIMTAHKFPRSIKRFRDECLALVTLTESVADGCIYALPRDGKTIEGPSARFAEVVANTWGNCRAGARVVDEGAEFITAQGVFHDLEKNVAITYEVKRRITDKNGNRYKADMIGVTGNAASSIALRNAILKGVPKAFWSDMYDAARKVVMGDTKTLVNRRAEAIVYLQKFGVTTEQICARLGVAGVDDIGLENLVTLRGIATAIKEGETTAEAAFVEAAHIVLMPQAKKKDREPKAEKQNVDTETGEISQTQAKPAASAAAPAAAPQGTITGLSETQMRLLRDLQSQAGIDDPALLLKFGSVTLENFNAVRAWLKDQARSAN